uniref:Uncharacterized protein C24B11.05 n=1 Tax=Anthurium amnicola TaxID=1678845 RepID=A0A1D1Y0A1_9ARAE
MMACPAKRPPVGDPLPRVPRSTTTTNHSCLPRPPLPVASIRYRKRTTSSSSSSSKSPFDCILFDLDDTLYSSDVGIARFVRQNIEEFLGKTCGVAAEAASALRSELFRSYGSSLAGLRALGYDVHPDDYHSYVHGRLPYEAIRPDPLLRDLLQSIPQTKIIFTNSDREHARKALQRLGLDVGGCFDGLICFETLNPDASATTVVLKPSPSAFEAAVRIAGVDPQSTLFLDDSERNVAAGKALGLRTALVGKRAGEADYLVGSIGDLRRAIPEIWRGREGKDAGAGAGQDQRKPRAGDLDSILASSATTAPVEA